MWIVCMWELRLRRINPWSIIHHTKSESIVFNLVETRISKRLTYNSHVSMNCNYAKNNVSAFFNSWNQLNESSIRFMQIVYFFLWQLLFEYHRYLLAPKQDLRWLLAHRIEFFVGLKNNMIERDCWTSIAFWCGDNQLDNYSLIRWEFLSLIIIEFRCAKRL